MEQIPFVPISIDIHASISDVIKTLKNDILCKIFPSDSNWSTDTIEILKLATISGGITNKLYLLESLNSDSKLIIRIFGSGTELFIEREKENLVFSFLSSVNIGPKFFGLFQNGRIEGYLNATCLKPEEMKIEENFLGIADAVSKFHKLTFEGIKSNKNWLWEKIHLFLNISTSLPSKFSNDSNKLKQLESINLPLINDQFNWLKMAITQLENVELTSLKNKGIRFALDQVLCHNDLLSGNILKGNLIPEFFLIDYEYSAFNYRAYDLANHFCEYGGFEFNIKKDFPEFEIRKKFIIQYLRSVFPVNDLQLQDLDEFISGFELVVEFMCLSSHLFWGSWSLVQAGNSLIDFDYLEYSYLRFYDGFFYHKSHFQLGKKLLEN